MKNKRNVVIKHLFSGWMLLYGILALVPMVMNIVWNLNDLTNLHNFAFHLFDISFKFIGTLTIIIISVGNQRKFTYLIQNSISRKTFWQAKSITLILVSLLIAVFNTLIYNLIQKPLGIIMVDNYDDFYGHLFAYAWQNQLLSVGLDFLDLLSLGAVVMMLAVCFALCSRTVKIILVILVISGPFSWGLLGINLMTSAIKQETLVASLRVLQNAYSFVFGYSPNVALGHYNPTMLFIILILLSIISIGLSYFAFLRLQIRNT